MIKPLILILLSILTGFAVANGAEQPTEVQYVHEKDDVSNSDTAPDNDVQDNYRLLNDLKADHPSPQIPRWNPYHILPDPMPTNKFLPLIRYPQPIFIPYPVVIPPEMFYQLPATNDMEDTMGRSNNQRHSSHRNSPIYYVRLPPTPYMFLPGLGYNPQLTPFTPNFHPLLPYNSYSSVPLSSVFNVPMNFLANGKPTGIYQMSSPGDLQNQLPTFNVHRTPSQGYRPSYLPQPSYTTPTEAKLINLKKPFVFNGQPEEIYIMPNNINLVQPIYPEPLSGYY